MGQDYNHTIGIWDTATGQLLAHTRGGEAKVFDIQWAPNGGGGSFVQVGFQHIKFHVLRGRNVDTEMGIFGDEKDVPFTTMMCVGFVKGTSLCCTCWLYWLYSLCTFQCRHQYEQARITLTVACIRVFLYV